MEYFFSTNNLRSGTIQSNSKVLTLEDIVLPFTQLTNIYIALFILHIPLPSFVLMSSDIKSMCINFTIVKFNLMGSRSGMWTRALN